MKGIILAVSLIFICSYAQAQCVPEFKDAEIDKDRGSVKVLTQYVFNGVAVDVAGVPCDNCIYVSGRYDESQGTFEEIIALNDSDTDAHCFNLIIRNLSQVTKEELRIIKLNETKKQNEALKEEFKKSIGTKKTIAEVKTQFKGKEITINADGSYTVTDIP